MNRNMLICATLPFALALGACGGDDGPSGSGDDATSGITSLGDGDGDPTTGDGDGDPTTGDGDGEPTGDGDGDTGPDCGSVSIVPTYIPPNIMIVVDASGSMVTNSWDHDLDPDTPDETRWKTLHNTVDTILASFGPAMNAGIQRFPADGACVPACTFTNACAVNSSPEVSIALDNGAAIMAALPPASDTGQSIKGGTPTTKGINSAVGELSGIAAGLPRYILLITDGAANCMAGTENTQNAYELYDEMLSPTVQAARDNDEVTTFVIGIDIINALLGTGIDGQPEANPFERLNEVALAGGAPKNNGLEAEKFYNSTNQAELFEALDGIIDAITECTIDLTMTPEGPPAPIQIPFITFTSNGMDVPFVEDCSEGDGWTWVVEGEIMTFCGQYCEDFKAGGATFDGTYGCPPAG
jgi:hypothetical protein